ncbi:MAG TPA: hypothetical protein VGU25_04760 [Acidobacteriaceae bacterium]|nr:hypothetical protein [Acidobacteriaceae bacterium]
MSLRTRHLACLFLLLSTLGAAQANASSSPRGFHGDRITALLYRHAVDAHNEHFAQNTADSAVDPETLLTPAPALAAVFHSTWTMRPPAAHSAAIFAATSFARNAAL